MKYIIDNKNKIASLYISTEEANNKDFMLKVKGICTKLKQNKFFPAIIESGNASLEEGISALLDTNLKSILGKEMAS